MAEKKKYAPKEASGGGMLAILSRADLELSNLKKAKISVSSRYYRKHSVDLDDTKYGFRHYLNKDIEFAGSQEEWLNAFEYFWSQEHNKKGHKTDRIGKYDYLIPYNKEQFGEGVRKNEDHSIDSSDKC